MLLVTTVQDECYFKEGVLSEEEGSTNNWQVKYLCEVNISIMSEFVYKQVEETEHHIACHPSHVALWELIKMPL